MLTVSTLTHEFCTFCYVFRIRSVSPARVSCLQSSTTEEESGSSQIHQLDTDVLSMLTGKPILALAFENMTMHVDAPTVVVAERGTKQRHGLLSKFLTFGAPAIPAAPT